MQRFVNWHYKRTTLVFVLALAFLIGVALAKTNVLIGFSWALMAGLLVLVFVRRQNWLVIILIILFGLSLGWWRGSVYMQKLAVNENYYSQKVTITASATSDAAYGTNKQLDFTAKNAVIDASGQKLAGRIKLAGFGVNMVYAGDQVRASGKLYPSRGNHQAQISYANLTITGHHNSVINELRRRFTAGMQSALPPPLGSFGMGLLIGQKVTLAPSVYQDLLMVGLVHIIAVSGYNLTILLDAARRLLGERSKRLTTFLSLALVGIFLLFTGTSPSIVRAAIIAVLAITASYYGRSFKPLVLLLVAAAITGYMNPFYVWGNASWYLSFLAFFGVLVLAPMLKARYFSERWASSLVASVALESFCAEIMTLPFVLHTFGQLSFAAIVANVLVAAFTPLAMALSFVAGLAGMLIAPVAGWLAWPAKIVLTYMLDSAHSLARIPHVFAQNLEFSITKLIILYLVFGFAALALWHKTKSVKPDKLTDNERTQQMVDNQAPEGR